VQKSFFHLDISAGKNDVGLVVGPSAGASSVRPEEVLSSRTLVGMPRKTSEFEHAAGTSVVERLGGPQGHQFLLVHGLGAGASYWAPLADVLARTGVVHVLQLPGFGRAPRPSTPLSVEALAAVVTGYARARGLDRPMLVGHSMGAQIVVEAALRDPDAFSAVVLLGPVVDPEAPRAWQQGRRLLTDVLLETPSANWATLRDYARTGPRWYLASLPPMLAYRTETAVARLALPLLVLRGARDPIATRGWVEQLRRLAPVARTVEVPGAAHVVMFTHPEEVAREILVHAEDAVVRS
jgi:pimeloyl-ACP methyl ester carboxylesterase